MIRFSRTLSSTSSVSACGTTPRRPRISGPCVAGSIPNTVSVPEVTGETHEIMRIVDVLPAPFGPRNPKASPRPTSKSTPSTATRLPKRLVSLRATMSGEASCIRATILRGAGPSRFRIFDAVLGEDRDEPNDGTEPDQAQHAARQHRGEDAPDARDHTGLEISKPGACSHDHCIERAHPAAHLVGDGLLQD